MSNPFTSGRDAYARKGYHHGNLREALVEAGRFLIAERGPQGFSLVEAARLVEVSPAAPYRHFKDREALVAEVAKRGGEAFAARMSAAARQAPGPMERMRELGAAYLAFAREEPGLYRALFDGTSAAAPPTAGAAFDLLVEAIKASRADHPSPEAAALAIWALSHGIAGLSAATCWPATGPRPEDVLADGAKAILGAEPA
jgi:AcrR family transcriptional regulator